MEWPFRKHKNYCHLNQVKNKLRNRTYSIITFTFGGTGCYQNPYWCEQDNIGSCQREHTITKFFLIKHSKKILWTYFFLQSKAGKHKILQYFFLWILPEISKIYVVKNIDFLCSHKNYYHKNFKNVQIGKINVAKII